MYLWAEPNKNAEKNVFRTFLLWGTHHLSSPSKSHFGHFYFSSATTKGWILLVEPPHQFLIAIGSFMHGVDLPGHWLRLSAITVNELLHRCWSHKRSIHLCRVWSLPRSAFRCTTCGANWILLWCCLKLTIGYVSSGTSWEALWCRSMSDTDCDLIWVISLKTQSNENLVWWFRRDNWKVSHQKPCASSLFYTEEIIFLRKGTFIHVVSAWGDQ